MAAPIVMSATEAHNRNTIMGKAYELENTLHRIALNLENCLNSIRGPVPKEVNAVRTPPEDNLESVLSGAQIHANYIDSQLLELLKKIDGTEVTA